MFRAALLYHTCNHCTLHKQKKIKTHAQDSEIFFWFDDEKLFRLFFLGYLNLKMTPFLRSDREDDLFVLRNRENWRPNVDITLPNKTQFVFSILLIKNQINFEHVVQRSIRSGNRLENCFWSKNFCPVRIWNGDHIDANFALLPQKLCVLCAVIS